MYLVKQVSRQLPAKNGHYILENCLREACPGKNGKVTDRLDTTSRLTGSLNLYTKNKAFRFCTKVVSLNMIKRKRYAMTKN